MLWLSDSDGTVSFVAFVGDCLRCCWLVSFVLIAINETCAHFTVQQSFLLAPAFINCVHSVFTKSKMHRISHPKMLHYSSDTQHPWKHRQTCIDAMRGQFKVLSAPKKMSISIAATGFSQHTPCVCADFGDAAAFACGELNRKSNEFRFLLPSPRCRSSDFACCVNKSIDQSRLRHPFPAGTNALLCGRRFDAWIRFQIVINLYSDILHWSQLRFLLVFSSHVSIVLRAFAATACALIRFAFHPTSKLTARIQSHHRRIHTNSLTSSAIANILAAAPSVPTKLNRISFWIANECALYKYVAHTGRPIRDPRTNNNRVDRFKRNETAINVNYEYKWLCLRSVLIRRLRTACDTRTHMPQDRVNTKVYLIGLAFALLFSHFARHFVSPRRKSALRPCKVQEIQKVTHIRIVLAAREHWVGLCDLRRVLIAYSILMD